MADAVVNGKPDVLRGYLADDFSYAGLSRDDIVRRVIQTTKAYDVADIHTFNYDVEELDRSQGTAKIFFRANVDGGRYLCACRADFRLIGEQWKMQKIEAFNPVV